MAPCFDSPTCASCCLKTCSVTITIILMAICLERLVLDLLGYQWTGCIFDFATVLSCLFAVAAVCQLRPAFCYAVGAWLFAWLGWNAFLICFYLDVGRLQTRAPDVLHWGTGHASYWRRLLLACHSYRLQLRLSGSSAVTVAPGNGTNAAICLVDYRTAELLQCAAGGLAAVLSLLLLCCLTCQLREELRKYSSPSAAASGLLSLPHGGGGASYFAVDAAGTGVSGKLAKPGQRMRSSTERRRGHRRHSRGDADGADAAAVIAGGPSLGLSGSYYDGSLGRRSAGSRRSSVMRDPLPWVELQVTSGPPPPQPQLPLAQQQQQLQQQQKHQKNRQRSSSQRKRRSRDSLSSSGGESSSAFEDDARPPPYSASIESLDRLSRSRAQQQQVQPKHRRRYRSAGSSGSRRRKAQQRNQAAATALALPSQQQLTMPIQPVSSLGYGYHENPAYARDDELGLSGGSGLGVVNRTFTLSSESVVGPQAASAGPATPYASGAAPMFGLLPLTHQPLPVQRSQAQPPQPPPVAAHQPLKRAFDVLASDAAEFPPPPSPQQMLFDFPPPQQPQSQLARQQPNNTNASGRQLAAVGGQQHRPLRGAISASETNFSSSSRSRAPISTDAAALDQFVPTADFPGGRQPPWPQPLHPQPQQQQQRMSLQRGPAEMMKPIFVSTRSEAAALPSTSPKAGAAASATVSTPRSSSFDPQLQTPQRSNGPSSAASSLHGGSVLI